ncbi:MULTISPECIES: AAA family ATPase [Polaromonas]|uniref:AAA family ATPase n=1 Tax=Polaromonas aquatica TaxID=332657 RepID=A0ABW1TY18_9BURK
MIKTFALTNFKVFGSQQRFDLAPITLIYGPNSGGKSSIIQALLLLKQSVQAPINQGLRDRVLIPKGLYVDLGQSKSIHHKHLFENSISLEVGFKFSAQAASRIYRPILLENDEFYTSLRFEHREDSIRAKLPAVAEIRYKIISKLRTTLSMSLVKDIKPTRKITGDELDLEDANELRNTINFFKFHSLSDMRAFSSFLNELPPTRGEEIQRDYFELDDFPDKEKNRFQVGFRPSISGKTTYLPTTVRNLSQTDGRRTESHLGILDGPSQVLSQIAREFNLQFEAMSYLGPLRSRPRRLYELSQQYQGSIGSSGEYAVEALKTDMSMESSDDHSVIDFVNKWLETFEIPYTVAIDEIGNEVLGDLAMLKLCDKRTGLWVAATDVGFGIGQLLPVIIEGALAVRSNNANRREKAICIEQPEIHLHPRLQANVADFLIETARTSSCQWIIETHSEALMLRIQKRIREGTLAAESVSVVFVEPTGENGSRIINLRLDNNGNFIDEWPGGFFEENFSEMFF